MFEIAGSILGSMQRRFNIYHKSLIHIEGGLGSQILGAIAFWNLQLQLGEEKAKCDLTYFHNQTNKLWPYQLDKYNLPLSEFKKYEKVSKKNLLKAKKDFLEEAFLETRYWEESRNRYLEKFKFSKNELNDYFNAFTVNLVEPYAALHIRRGDYLQVASHLVAIDEYLNILSLTSGLIPKRLIIVSDSQISNESKIAFSSLLSDKEVIFLDSLHLDSFKVHCLLREAEVLVTANSTYSFSAALLGRENQVAFSPMQFHSGSNSKKYNDTFRLAGSFFIWPARS